MQNKTERAGKQCCQMVVTEIC